MKKYLFFVSLAYAYPILRPLQEEIRKRGDEVAWYFDSPCSQYLRPDEKRLKSVKEVMRYNPVAVFVPGNYVYDFFPGIKVQVFHGYSIDKRPGKGDHFKIRGLFDLYCTQGKTSTPYFKELEKKYGYFRVVETGWSKTDTFFTSSLPVKNKRPVILYASTFSPRITSTPFLYEAIETLVRQRDWEWLITFHPHMDRQTVERYRRLEEYENVTYCETDDNVELLKRADVLLCDSSSIITEFLLLGKPAVTYKNTHPGNYLLDIQDTALLEDALLRALERPPELMENIRRYVDGQQMYRDGKSSARILNAVDRFIAEGKGGLKRKPLNLFRRLKMRWKARYFPFGPWA